jgi:hypothetical protein
MSGATSHTVDVPGAVLTTPEVHAEDICAVIRAAVGSGPVDVLASSGGSVNMLAESFGLITQSFATRLREVLDD